MQGEALVAAYGVVCWGEDAGGRAGGVVCSDYFAEAVGAGLVFVGGERGCEDEEPAVCAVEGLGGAHGYNCRRVVMLDWLCP